MEKNLDDILVVVGCGLFVYATSLWSDIAAWYSAAIILIVAGLIIGLGKKKPE